MLRSGLILAGANYFWKQNKIPPGMKEDGVLTAEEISHLDLSATELAVLSACETGLGDIEGNEGVYGLQRAFKIAGTHHLIMSLWKIPDKESKVFMVTFYQNWLVNKLSVRHAFHQTQRQMREDHSAKYSWAGFVLLE
jgi:CHAT domain-containing protein